MEANLHGKPSWASKRIVELKSKLVSLVDTEWAILKQVDKNEVLETFFKNVGMVEVKRVALDLFKKHLSLAQQQDKTSRLNFAFLAGAGTGKTTVARMFAKLLHSCNLRSNDKLVECSAQQLMDGGISALNKAVLEAMGGVLFIDEAYMLDPYAEGPGRAIASELLTVCENHRDQLSIIVAGYPDVMVQKFFSWNSGLGSRFEQIVFDPLSREEIEVAWLQSLQECGWSIEEKPCRIAVDRIEESAKSPDFGSRRSIRNAANRAISAAIGRQFTQKIAQLCVKHLQSLCSTENRAKLTNELQSYLGDSGITETDVSRLDSEFNGISSESDIESVIRAFAKSLGTCLNRKEDEMMCFARSKANETVFENADTTKVLEAEDVIGKPPKVVLESMTPRFSRDSCWNIVKPNLDALVDFESKSYDILQQMNPNRGDFQRLFVFSSFGEKPTGRMACAKMYCAFLKELGVIAYGTVLDKNIEDFEIAADSKKYMRKAVGNVLVVKVDTKRDKANQNVDGTSLVENDRRAKGFAMLSRRIAAFPNVVVILMVDNDDPEKLLGSLYKKSKCQLRFERPKVTYTDSQS